MLCRDIMIDAAIAFQEELARLVESFVEEGEFRLKEGVSPGDVAQLLANGARGVNQGLPPPPTADLRERYYQMSRAVLFGSAEMETPEAERAEKARARSGRR
jgi:hypothetical protein